MFGYDSDVKSLDTESLRTFIDAFKNEQLKPMEGHGGVMSEPIPENNDGPLTKLVGDNLIDYLLNDDIELFVMFHHTDCGHCQAMKQDWQDLADSVADIPDLVIGEFNTEFNEIPGLDIESIPDLKMYPRMRNYEGTEALTYPGDGQRTVESFLKYLSDYS